MENPKNSVGSHNFLWRRLHAAHLFVREPSIRGVCTLRRYS